jgi:hypothetical protein
MAATRKHTASFRRLRRNLKRGRTLLDRFFDNPGGKPRGVGQPAAHEQELLRSVLVLAVGALDAYLSELVIELMPKLAQSGRAQVIFERLMKENAGLVLQAVYLGGDELDAALASAVESQFLRTVMHGSKAVRQVSDWCVLNLSFDNFDSDRFPQAMKLLDEWTDKRHRIVHRGELVKMKRHEATSVLDLVEHIGRVLNDRALKVGT